MPSGSTVFVDTNVLLYAQDGRDESKQRAAQSWLDWCWRSTSGRLSTQVLNELDANLQRLAPSMSLDGRRALVRRYRAWSPWAVDDMTVDDAWDIQDRFAVGFWDALIVAAARAQGCDVILTEDLQHDQRIDGLRIVDPFRSSPTDVRP